MRPTRPRGARWSAMGRRGAHRGIPLEPHVLRPASPSMARSDRGTVSRRATRGCRDEGTPAGRGGALEGSGSRAELKPLMHLERILALRASPDSRYVVAGRWCGRHSRHRVAIRTVSPWRDIMGAFDHFATM